jgi:hypothetical protein
VRIFGFRISGMGCVGAAPLMGDCGYDIVLSETEKTR